MNENIEKFLKKVDADPELQAKFSGIHGLEEAYQLAASIQGGFTQEEFEAEMKRLYAELTKDLSEEDMAKVAGGSDYLSAATVGAGISASAVSSAIALAAA